MLTKDRCEEIIRLCREKAVYGPWVDQMDKVMTKEERRQVMAHWETLPGHTSFYNAFMDLKRILGSHVEIEQKHVGKMLFSAYGREWRVSEFIGRIMPQDVGKRVYLVGDILQVENEQQRAERLKAR